MNKKKIAVIGTGHLGSIHSKLWAENTEAALAGIYDTDSSRAAELSGKLNCRQFASLEETIGNCDAVTIAAPTVYHHEIAKQCISAGRHCLIEKPITGTYSEAVELIALAEENKSVIQVGHVERFNPAISALKGYRLAPVFIEAHRLSQFKPRAIDVSVIHDLMIHDIDIMLWLVKSPVVSVEAKCVAVLTDTADIANARITFENGTVANLTASRISAHPMRKMRIFQKDAYISIDFGKPDVEVFRILRDGETGTGMSIPATMLGTLDAGIKNTNISFEKPEVPKVNAIAEEQYAFIHAIEGKTEVAVNAREAAEALKVAELISEQMNK